MFWWLALLIVPGVWVCYRFSAAYNARRLVRVALHEAEALAAASLQARDTKREAMREAAVALIQAVHEERLRAISIEVLKQHATGLRLQALRDAGLLNLFDLLESVMNFGPS